METTSREARKRRISERGSDRLALITGRIQTLPTQSSEPQLSHIPSCPPSVDRNLNLPVSDSDQIVSGSPQDEIKDLSSSLPKHEPTDEPAGGTLAEPEMRKCATSEASRAPALKLEGTSDTGPHSVPQTCHGNFFSPTQIVTAIICSEGHRIFFSFTTAVFVVLSYVGFPISSSSVMVKNVLLSRPLYLVLLTNISMVLARILLGKQRGGGIGVGMGGGPAAGGNNFNIGMALEMSFVLQNAASALCMDCSVFAVVVICGVSLSQKLGW